MKINGPLLKGLLLARKIKQWQLSKKIGMSDSNFSKIILGKINVSGTMLKRIAESIGISANDLKMPDNTSRLASRPAPRVRRVT